MKKVVEVQEVPNEGFMSLLGQKVLVYCVNFIYHGTLTGVNDDCILLETPSIVYDTGSHKSTGYAQIEALHCNRWYIQKSAIESFGPAK